MDASWLEYVGLGLYREKERNKETKNDQKKWIQWNNAGTVLQEKHNQYMVRTSLSWTLRCWNMLVCMFGLGWYRKKARKERHQYKVKIHVEHKKIPWLSYWEVIVIVSEYELTSFGRASRWPLRGTAGRTRWFLGHRGVLIKTITRCVVKQRLTVVFDIRPLQGPRLLAGIDITRIIRPGRTDLIFRITRTQLDDARHERRRVV